MRDNEETGPTEDRGHVERGHCGKSPRKQDQHPMVSHGTAGKPCVMSSIPPGEDMWKRLGFEHHVDEFWVLAKLVRECLRKAQGT